MIISPPFLLSRVGHDIDSADASNTVRSDQDICAAGMQECAPGNGAYPVSYNLGWHGGPHLIAPRAANGHTEPVRAIADGVVVYVRTTDASDITQDAVTGDPKTRDRYFGFCLRRPPLMLCGESLAIARPYYNETGLMPYALAILQSIQFIDTRSDDARTSPARK